MRVYYYLWRLFGVSYMKSHNLTFFKVPRHPLQNTTTLFKVPPPSSKYHTILFKVPRHPLQSTTTLFKVPHYPLQRTTPPSSKYHTTLFNVPHHPLQSNIPPSSKYHTTLFKLPHHLLQSTTPPSSKNHKPCSVAFSRSSIASLHFSLPLANWVINALAWSMLSPPSEHATNENNGSV